MKQTESSQARAKKWPFPSHKQYQRKLRKAAVDWFQSERKDVNPNAKYILKDHNKWKDNIICDDVYKYIQKEIANKEAGDNFPIHKYVHHGLSSQAMVFNLIGPLIQRNDLAPLLNVIREKGMDLPDINYTGMFEYECREVFQELSSQPTSIDLVLADKSQPSACLDKDGKSAGRHGRPIIFIEAKLTEASFGQCSLLSSGSCIGKNPLSDLNDCYLNFIGREYWEQLKKSGFDILMSTESVCVFGLYYQFFREVLFSLHFGGYFVLLHDARSPVFRSRVKGKKIGYMPFLMNFIPGQYRSRIADISIQEVVEEIENAGGNENWIVKFRKKYGLIEF